LPWDYLLPLGIAIVTALQQLLLHQYTTEGIGVAFDKSGNIYIVQDFIKP
jgi:hypothetical protein